MTITPEQNVIIQDWAKRVILDLNCPVCDGNKYTPQDIVSALLAPSPTGLTAIKGSPRMLRYTCDHCGYVFFFDVGPIGI